MKLFSLKSDSVSYGVYIILPPNYQLDLRTGDFKKLNGYSTQIINASQKGDLLPDITKSIDDIQIGCSLLSDSIVGGVTDDALDTFTTANFTSSYPFVEKPYHLLWSKSNKKRPKKLGFMLQQLMVCWHY